ncbi:MAG TPA: DUF2442 domain-containing protein [Lacipirellulaceae bacterium]
MNPIEINRVTAARVINDHAVELTFSDGFVGKLDLRPILSAPIFGPLADSSFFRQLRVEDDTIRWPNDADFYPDVLRYWCEAAGVRPRAETDAYFTQSLAARRFVIKPLRLRAFA